MEKIPITPEGYKKLENELQKLKTVEKPATINAIAEARAHGDLKENAEYHAAKEKQGFLEAKISDMESRITRAEIIDYKNFTEDTIQFGAQVILQDQESNTKFSYRIVGDFESNTTEGLISIASPLARALIGKKITEEVEVETPKGFRYYEILEIHYK